MKDFRKINFAPYLWGKHGWIFFSHVALSYPKNPTLEEKNAYKSFFMSIGSILPCEKCSINYEKHIKEIPIDKYLENKDTLFSWVIKMENKVNEVLNKPLLDEKKIKEKYMNPPRLSRKMKLILFLISSIGLYLLITSFMKIKIKIEFK